MIDYGMYFLFLIIYIPLFGKENEEGGQSVSGLLGLPILIYWFIYFIVVESIYGATLGHQAFYLRVLTINRNKIVFLQAVKRHLLGFLDMLVYGIPAIISIKNSDKHQRLGDMWAKTIVVDTTDKEQYTIEKEFDI